MTTPAQRGYIGILLENCEDRGIEISVELLEEIEDNELSIARASEIIDDLKFELGW